MLKLDKVDESLVKLAKWLVIFLLARVRNPLKLAGFLSLNPLFRKSIAGSLRSIARDKSLSSEQRCIDKTSNALTSGLLYSATVENASIPSDYIALYLWGYYLTSVSRKFKKVKNAASNLVCGKVGVVDSIFARIYQNKEFLLYSVLFGRMLSQYLTPLSVSPDRKYLASLVKTRQFDPIWKCFSLSASAFHVNWLDLVKIYVKQNLIIGSVLFAFANRGIIISRNFTSEESRAQLKVTLSKTFKKVNAFLNSVYLQNILSFILLSGSALTFSHWNSYSKLLKISSKRSTLYRTIVGVIGFISAYFSLYLNEKLSTGNDEKSKDSLISKTFLNGLNVYLFRLMIVSKWRKSKDHLKYINWINKDVIKKTETALMCLGLFKIMNYNSYLKQNNKTNLQTGLTLIVNKLM